MLVRMSFTITMSIFFAGWICCVMFACNDQSAASSVESEIQPLQGDVFHGDEISAESGEVWLGLYPTPNGYALILSKITVETVYAPLVDSVSFPSCYPDASHRLSSISLQHFLYFVV